MEIFKIVFLVLIVLVIPLFFIGVFLMSRRNKPGVPRKPQSRDERGDSAQ